MPNIAAGNPKLRYSCMPNMAKLISRHNKRILQKEIPIERACSCRNPELCPLQEQCLVKNVIYQASVKQLDSGKVETHTGLTSRKGGPTISPALDWKAIGMEPS